MTDYDIANLDNEIIEANQEMLDNDLATILNEEIKVYARDWTVQTICDQIIQGNIDLNPKFQRRNAWNDKRRSLLIESLLLDFPVPEIVFAENHEQKDTYIVLDGKQRLLTILGFIRPDLTNYWDNPKLIGLEMKKNLNGKTYQDLSQDESFRGEKRALENSSIRCTVIFGQKTDDLLYQIFYRLNSTSVPLSTQELRQALRKGQFSDFLIDITNHNLQPIHYVLGLSEPDRRLLDAEIILKFIAFRLFSQEYKGNLKQFLDNVMKRLNNQWANYQKEVEKQYNNFNAAIERYKNMYDSYEKIGRLAQDKRFNRNVFDVTVLYFALLSDTQVSEYKDNFITEYILFCKSNESFLSSLTSRTSSKDSYAKRFQAFEKLLNQVFHTNFLNKYIIHE